MFHREIDKTVQWCNHPGIFLSVQRGNQNQNRTKSRGGKPIPHRLFLLYDLNTPQSADVSIVFIRVIGVADFIRLLSL
jgi:hypothetical protein